MINEILLKQKLHEKTILENKLLKARKLNKHYTYIFELVFDIDALDIEIEQLQNS